jgi:toxin ParE1/3/4
VPPVVYTPQAERDYDEIIEYLDAHSPPAANRFAAGVADKCRLLARFPRLGRVRDELHPGIRSVLVAKYLLFYRFTDASVEIVRIIHGARNLGAVDWEPDDS